MLINRNCSVMDMLYLVGNHHLGSISASSMLTPFVNSFRMSHAILAIRVKVPASRRLCKPHCDHSCIQHALQIGPPHLRLSNGLILMYVLVILVASFLRLPMVQPRVLIGLVCRRVESSLRSLFGKGLSKACMTRNEASNFCNYYREKICRQLNGYVLHFDTLPTHHLSCGCTKQTNFNTKS